MLIQLSSEARLDGTRMAQDVCKLNIWLEKKYYDILSII